MAWECPETYELFSMRSVAVWVLGSHVRVDGCCPWCRSVFPCELARLSDNFLVLSDAAIRPLGYKARVSRGKEGC